MMRSVADGDLSVSMETDRKDEVGQLGGAFGHMMERTRHLIDELLLREREKRRAELQALQAQISPHFLFNTIHSIKCVAAIDRNLQIHTMSSNLMDLLRMSFRHDSLGIQLHQEVDNVKKYLAIMEQRYGAGAIDVVYTLDDRVASCAIPKLTLQPLVENAIRHGLDMARANNRLELRTRLDGDFAVIDVMDNGHGMPRPKRVASSEDNAYHDRHVGLDNVAHRLNLFFERECPLRVESAPGKGTTVSICIPREPV
jgi:two-component system sensor histidine kinase YesM